MTASPKRDSRFAKLFLSHTVNVFLDRHHCKVELVYIKYSVDKIAFGFLTFCLSQFENMFVLYIYLYHPFALKLYNVCIRWYKCSSLVDNIHRKHFSLVSLNIF